MDHLKRCKTSNLLDDVLQWFSNLTLPFWLFHLIFQQKQGGKAFSDYLAQRSYVTEGEATGDAQLCTCHPPAGGCVCVDHLKRCKTSNLLDDVLQWFSNLTLPWKITILIGKTSINGPWLPLPC